jgi:hypothetical protein
MKKKQGVFRFFSKKGLLTESRSPVSRQNLYSKLVQVGKKCVSDGKSDDSLGFSH